jgi:hypothetical protein
MAPHKVAGGREFGLSAALTATAYLAFYLLFTGAIQHLTTPTIGLRGAHIIYTYVETTLYVGPIIQIIGDGYLINIRLYSVALAAAISILVGINAGLLWNLYRRRVLRACLLGGTWGGAGGLLASVISFGYACCGWPASLAIFGTGLIASLSPYLTTSAALLLAANAYNLNRRLKTLTGGLQAK